MERIEQALALPGVARFVSSQPQYSALWREPEREVFPLCERHGIGQVVWSPLAQGVLTGKYQPRRAAARRLARRGLDGPLHGPAAAPEGARRRPAAAPDRRRGGPDDVPARARLGAALARTSRAAIVGASRPEQVRENAAAAGVRRPTDVVAAVDAALEGVAAR